MRRATEVLGRYAALLTRCRVDRVEAVAPSAVREAANGAAFVRRVRARTGLPLRIISGKEEARLIYLGVLQTHRFPRASLLVTIGGGSAQVVCGDGARLRYAASVPLGGARLAQRFLQHDPPALTEVRAMQEEVVRVWQPVLRAVRRHRWTNALGSSATIAQVMAAGAWLTCHQVPVKTSRLAVSRAALVRLIGWLVDSTASERIQLPGLDPRREDLALSTAVTLLAWMEGCGISTLRYASGSLREGLVLNYLLQHRQKLVGDLEWPLSGLFGSNGHDDLVLPKGARKRLRNTLMRRRERV
jgi:exopolyphosphatase/guanosine-5'-triphosphate,3'-diphosphate pyrophosphatase